MKTEFVLNGQLSLVLIPENPMETEMLKQLGKQRLEAVEIKNPVQIINKTVKDGLIISGPIAVNETSSQTV